MPRTSNAGSVRFVVFGDFGDGSDGQKGVARAMAAYDAKKPFDFGLTVGDNFYEEGLTTAFDPRWQSEWEDLYDPLGVRVYATLGNHDYENAASPIAEMERSRRSSSWCLPKPYYAFSAGPVDLFALDTTPIERGNGQSTADQVTWLDAALGASTARWKVVYGHHPIYSSGGHDDTAQLVAAIQPILAKHHASLYLAGHDHHLESQKPNDGVWYVISGAGGHSPRVVDAAKVDRCSAWATRNKELGFAVIEADAKRLKVEFVGVDGKIFHAFETDGGSAANCAR